MRRLLLGIGSAALLVGAVAALARRPDGPTARVVPAQAITSRVSRRPTAEASLITAIEVEKPRACVGEPVLVRVSLAPGFRVRTFIDRAPGEMAMVRAARPGTKQIAVEVEAESRGLRDTGHASFEAVACATPTARLAVIDRRSPAQITVTWLGGACDRDHALYRWDFGDGEEPAVTADPEAAHELPLAERGRTYLVTAEQTDEQGCRARGQVTVRVDATRETEEIRAESRDAMRRLLAARAAEAAAARATAGLGGGRR